ncbi:unnamed protein product [Meloidogyne enterolobii]|uniref:Uncharacterized protein n=1 Tax=Meloidogyne enterolobii TaxID=390850 RepID=A0ACB1A2H9_MELEN
MPQTEKVKTGFQSNIWDKGIEVIRFVKEREKTFREKLEDDFCEGRAVQVEEPLYVTFKHALKKDLKLKRMRAERKKDAKEQQVMKMEVPFLRTFFCGLFFLFSGLQSMITTTSSKAQLNTKL